MIWFVIAALVALLLMAVPVGAVMGLLGLAADQLFSPVPLSRAMGQIMWNSSQKYEFLAVPLFVMMGELFMRSGVAQQMYGCLRQWLSWLPGGLMHSNIGACALFAATSGSSVATAATISTLALPEQKGQDYNERLFLGTLAAGGTLGILIPPSVNMIVFGVMTDTSIPQLYMAGIFPGIILTLLFMVVVVMACLAVPRWSGKAVETSWHERWKSLKYVLPPLSLFIIVIGSIYTGLATPTEAAAIGVVFTLAIAVMRGRFNLAMLRASIEGALRTTTMVLFIVIGAFFLNFIMVATGAMARITALITDNGLSPTAVMTIIVVVYVVLGCFMDALAMVITTVPIVTPVVVGLGYDPVWFGILIVLLTEASLITPPVGINLFVLQNVRRNGPMMDVIVGSSPFLIAIAIMMALLFIFPSLALYLPTLLYR